MSGNTSATGGYLSIISTPPLDDDALGNILQGLVVGITGLDPTLVRPRWQAQPPTQPSASTNWVAIGITSYSRYDFPEITHDSQSSTNGVGFSTLHRFEQINTLTTFYGPQSNGIASSFRDGLYVSQNLETLLSLSGLKLRGAEDIHRVPELINSQYVNRSDVEVSFVRFIERDYPIENLLGAVVDIIVDEPDIDELVNVSQ